MGLLVWGFYSSTLKQQRAEVTGQSSHALAVNTQRAVNPLNAASTWSLHIWATPFGCWHNKVTRGWILLSSSPTLQVCSPHSACCHIQLLPAHRGCSFQRTVQISLQHFPPHTYLTEGDKDTWAEANYFGSKREINKRTNGNWTLKVSENWAPNSHLALEKSPCHSSIICQRLSLRKICILMLAFLLTDLTVSARKKKGH